MSDHGHSPQEITARIGAPPGRGVLKDAVYGAIDGAVLSGDLTWSFADETDMVFSAGIAQGSSAVESSEDPEWFVGLMLRRQTNVFSGGS